MKKQEIKQDNTLNTRITSFFKCIADETRVNIIYTIADNEICVNDIAKQLEMSQSAISHQLSVLKKEGFVKSRREGKNVYYFLDDEHVVDLIRTASIHIQHKIKEEQ